MVMIELVYCKITGKTRSMPKVRTKYTARKVYKKRHD